MHRLILFTAVGLMFCSAHTHVTDYAEEYVGYAYEHGNSKPVYSEEATSHFINGRCAEMLTHYFDRNKKLIAKRTLDFGRSLFAPDFITEDLRIGSLEGAEFRNESVRLFFRKDKNSLMKEKTLQVPQPVVIDGGFNHFIKANWSRLVNGETVTFYFTISSELDYFKLRAFKTTLTDSEMTVKIEADNALMRWFASPIIISYDRATKRITSYEGKSNIANEDGRSFIIKLVYPEKGP
jgi:hypothetical protein